MNAIKSDLYRYNGKTSIGEFFKNYILNRGFKITLSYRICNAFSGVKPVFKILSVIHKRKCNRYTIALPLGTPIGKGIYIGHAYSIAISKYCSIGNNVNISQGVTIGYKHSGERKGAPKIGDSVYIEPNTVIIGNIKIGNNVVIGANSVVIKDIEDNSVVAGNPVKIISDNGSEGIVNNRCHV
jgi:serine O-acetyltransferase